MPSKQVNNAMSMKQLIADQNRLLEEANQIAKDRLATDRSITSEQQDVSNVLKDQLTQLKFQKAEKSAILRATNSISKISENLSALGKEDLTNSKSLKKLEDNRLAVSKNINSLKQVQSKLIRDAAGLDETRAELNIDLAESIQSQINSAIALKVELGLVNDTVQNIANARGVSLFGGIEKVLDKIPILSGLAPMFGAAAKEAEGIASDMEKRKFGAEQFEKLVDEGMAWEDALKESGATEDDIMKNLEGGFSKAAVDSASMAAGAQGMLESFMKSLGPVALLTKLVMAIIEGDKAASEMAKGLNMSYDSALAMRKSLREAAVDSGNIFVSTKGMSESMMVMNKALGTSIEPSNELLTQFTEMREMAGFTNEELLGLKAISDATGMSLNDITGEFMAQAQISATSLGVKLNEKDLVKDIHKISAATTLSFGKQPRLIAEAVATAKSLGMELSKVDAIASSLLDFESSISNELEAELLLNKDLNLEKARQAALNNDLATVAEEISEQAGSAAEFGEMNRIQQNALAKAVGMGREELAQTLFIQEQLVGVTGEQAAETEELLNKRIAAVGLEQAQKELAEDGVEGLRDQVGMADRLAASTERINEIFGMIGESMLPVFELLVGIVEMVGYIITPFQMIMDLTGKIGEGISNMIGPLGMVGKALKSLVGLAIIFAAYKTYASISSGMLYTGPGAILAPVVGGIAAAAILAAGFGALNKIGDMDSPAKGRTIVSTKEGGLFEASPNDDLVLAPGASKRMQNDQTIQTTQTTVVADNSRIEKLLSEMLTGQTQLIKKTPEMAPLGMYEVQ
ncbi:hypothetical protein N9Q43_00660 [bacterium]|nr:hypothetical protein [bacterium]